MKWVYFGYDFMLPAVEDVLRAGHTLIGIFSFPCDQIFNFNTQCQNLAKNLNIPFTEEKPSPEAIEAYIAKGAEVFLSAGYLYKIPPIDPDKAYGINFHPSYLPQARGMMPSPHIIMNERDASGVTLHKLTPEYDAGDILWQKKLPLADSDDVDQLSAKVALAGLQNLPEIFDNIEQYWKGAKPQDESAATTCPPPSDEMRVIDWNADVQTIKRMAKAFGKYGCLARVQDKALAVRQLSAWEEPHDYAPGDIVLVFNAEILVAAKNGYVLIKNFQEIRVQ